jgi:hypothetical protein
MRNLKQSIQDKFNKSIADKLEEILAPSGYQNHPKYGEVSIRNVITKKTVMDIQYDVITEMSKNKIQMLVAIKKDMQKARNIIADCTIKIQEIEAAHGSMLSQWIHKKYGTLQSLRMRRREQTAVLSYINDFRLSVLSIGAALPDSQLLKHGL